MSPKLFLTLCCLLFVAAASHAEPSKDGPQPTTMNQPSPKPVNRDKGTTTPARPASSSGNDQKKTDMVAFCKEHTC